MVSNSKFILGIVQLGMPYGLGKLKHKIMSENESFEILNKALSIGINTFDTSPNYGLANDRIIKFMKTNSNKSFNIITKLKFDMKTKINCNNVREKLEKEGFVKLTNCKNLSVLLHDENDIYNQKLINSISLLKKNNYISRWGVSVYNIENALETLKYDDCDLIQLPLGLLNQQMLYNGVLDELANANKIILARSIFTQGLLFTSLKEEIYNKELIGLRNYLAKIRDSLNISLFKIACNYIGSMKEIDHLVVGVDQTSHLDEISNINFELPLSVSKELKRFGKRIPEDFVRPEKWEK